MDFQLNEQEQKIQQKARRFVEEYVLPNAKDWDRQEFFPEETLKACAASGLTGLTVPQLLGGPGMSTTCYSLAIMELARGCSSFAVTIAVSSMVAEILSIFGTPEQHKDFLLPILTGDFTSGSFALSEPSAGSDAGSLRTKATVEGDDVIIHGEKTWISSGTHSGAFVVWARSEEEKGAKGISTFLMSPEDKGFSIGKKEDKMGLRASTTVSLAFDQCKIPFQRLLGKRGEGFKIAMRALDGGRIGVSSQAIGIATRALEVANSYFQEVRVATEAEKEKLARLEAELQSARLLTWKAAFLKDQQKPFSTEAAMAKAYGTETANHVCQECVALLGIDGCRDEFPVEKLFRDCKVTTIYEGTSEVQRIVISRSLTRD